MLDGGDLEVASGAAARKARQGRPSNRTALYRARPASARVSRASVGCRL